LKRYFLRIQTGDRILTLLILLRSFAEVDAVTVKTSIQLISSLDRGSQIGKSAQALLVRLLYALSAFIEAQKRTHTT